MTAELPIEQRTLDGVEGGVYVRPSGPVRGPSGVAFRDHIARILPDTQALVIDLSEVQHIESAALGYLLNVHDDLTERGGRLALADLSEAVQVVLDSIGFTSLFTITDTIDEAAEAVSETDVSDEGPLGLA